MFYQTVCVAGTGWASVFSLMSLDEREIGVRFARLDAVCKFHLPQIRPPLTMYTRAHVIAVI